MHNSELQQKLNHFESPQDDQQLQESNFKATSKRSKINLKSQVQLTKKPSVSFNLGRIVPKNISHDKEFLYSENMRLREMLQEVKDENNKLKTRLVMISKQKDQLVGNMMPLDIGIQRVNSKSLSRKISNTSNISIHNNNYLKKLLRESKDECQKLKKQNFKIKRTVKYTQLQELLAENVRYNNQCIRLTQLLSSDNFMNSNLGQRIDQIKAELTFEKETSRSLLGQMKRKNEENQRLKAQIKQAEDNCKKITKQYNALRVKGRAQKGGNPLIRDGVLGRKTPVQKCQKCSQSREDIRIISEQLESARRKIQQLSLALKRQKRETQSRKNQSAFSKVSEAQLQSAAIPNKVAENYKTNKSHNQSLNGSSKQSNPLKNEKIKPKQEDEEVIYDFDGEGLNSDPEQGPQKLKVNDEADQKKKVDEGKHDQPVKQSSGQQIYDFEDEVLVSQQIPQQKPNSNRTKKGQTDKWIPQQKPTNKDQTDQSPKQQDEQIPQQKSTNKDQTDQSPKQQEFKKTDQLSKQEPQQIYDEQFEISKQKKQEQPTKKQQQQPKVQLQQEYQFDGDDAQKGGELPVDKQYHISKEDQIVLSKTLGYRFYAQRYTVFDMENDIESNNIDEISVQEFVSMFTLQPFLLNGQLLQDLLAYLFEKQELNEKQTISSKQFIRKCKVLIEEHPLLSEAQENKQLTAIKKYLGNQTNYTTLLKAFKKEENSPTTTSSERFKVTLKKHSKFSNQQLNLSLAEALLVSDDINHIKYKAWMDRMKEMKSDL